MLEIPPTSHLTTVPPAQDFILGLADQAVPHTRSWCFLATAINYLVRIAPIVYLAFQAWPASPVEVQLDSGMGHDRRFKNSSGHKLEIKAFWDSQAINLKKLQASGRGSNPETLDHLKSSKIIDELVIIKSKNLPEISNAKAGSVEPLEHIRPLDSTLKDVCNQITNQKHFELEITNNIVSLKLSTHILQAAACPSI
ncbi:hypothetical protein DSO57_1023080 [Entomophthora muscae]|uniref:Uncharacterized protein n=1 Tax=Entomophthora muscae TaxID=34485 RepID=A0ACC2TQA1_9FUNG|nr:hypothetical protein DSO57_1023080 [Entomophthora muscae]